MKNKISHLQLYLRKVLSAFPRNGTWIPGISNISVRRKSHKLAMAQTGSYAIPAAISLVGALSLILTYTDLSNYIASEQAAAAAARKVLRCLTPSDGACVTTSRSATDEELDWYSGYSASRSVQLADRYIYKASYYEQDWVAIVSTLERRVVNLPDILLDTVALPVINLQGRLNQFEKRTLIIQADGLRPIDEVESFYTPKYEPNFPAFDSDYEADTDQRSITSWNPRIPTYRANGKVAAYVDSNLPFTNVSGGTGNVNSQGKAFISPIIFVPTLPTATKIECTKNNGQLCDIPSHLQPGSTFTSHAALALKAFAKVTPPPGRKITVEWKGKNDSIGLIVQFWNASDTAKLRNGISVSPTDAMCLGGRDGTTISGNNDNYVNLWLRGPQGSNGGTHAVCPGGRTTHFPISVERAMVCRAQWPRTGRQYSR